MTDLGICPVCNTPCTVTRSQRGEVPDWIRYEGAFDFGTWRKALTRQERLLHQAVYLLALAVGPDACTPHHTPDCVHSNAVRFFDRSEVQQIYRQGPRIEDSL